MGVAMFLLWQLIGPALLAVSRTIVAGIWVAFFQECQQSSCGQGLLAMVAMMPVSYLTAYAARSLLTLLEECNPDASNDPAPYAVLVAEDDGLALERGGVRHRGVPGRSGR